MVWRPGPYFSKKGFCYDWHRGGGGKPPSLRNRYQEISEAQFFSTRGLPVIVILAPPNKLSKERKKKTPCFDAHTHCRRLCAKMVVKCTEKTLCMWQCSSVAVCVAQTSNTSPHVAPVQRINYLHIFSTPTILNVCNIFLKYLNTDASLVQTVKRLPRFEGQMLHTTASASIAAFAECENKQKQCGAGSACPPCAHALQLFRM